MQRSIDASRDLQARVMSTILSTGIVSSLSDTIVSALPDEWLMELARIMREEVPAPNTEGTPQQVRFLLHNTIRQGLRLAGEELEKANKAPRSSGKRYLIWTRKHPATPWWGPREAGYTADHTKAGRYEEGHAADILSRFRMPGEECFLIAEETVGKPDELAVQLRALVEGGAK